MIPENSKLIFGIFFFYFRKKIFSIMVANDFIKTNKILLKWSVLLVRNNNKPDLVDKLHNILILAALFLQLTPTTA